MKTKSVAMYCDGCGDDRRFARAQHEQTVCVRGEEITVMEPVLVCPRCGAIQPDLSDGVDSLSLAYEQYRHRHGLLSPQRIAEIRTQYGLSHEAFAAVLGMSPTTLFRYERGALQDAMPDSMIYACDDPQTMERLVDRNPKVLSELQLRRFREALVRIKARRGARDMVET